MFGVVIKTATVKIKVCDPASDVGGALPMERDGRSILDGKRR